MSKIIQLRYEITEVLLNLTKFRELRSGDREVSQLAYDHTAQTWKHREVRHLVYDNTTLRWKHRKVRQFSKDHTAQILKNRGVKQFP